MAVSPSDGFFFKAIIPEPAAFFNTRRGEKDAVPGRAGRRSLSFGLDKTADLV
jgi:hypothetical protein